jgi:hypothetical protein
MAQARTPASTQRRDWLCNTTGSGVVKPVGSHVQSPELEVGVPKPKVPTMAQGCAKRHKSWASHHAVEVLPLVPVMATADKSRMG